jgi:hypothetical protein
MSEKYTSVEHTARLVHEVKTNLLNPRKTSGGKSPAYTEHSGFTGVFRSKTQGSGVAAVRSRSMPYTDGARMTEDGAVPNEGNATPTSKAYGSFDEDGKKKKVKEETEQVNEIGPAIVAGLEGIAALGARALPWLTRAGKGSVTVGKEVAIGAGIDAATDALTGKGNNTSGNQTSTGTAVPNPLAPSTSAPKTSASSQYSPKRSNKTVKEEAEGSKDRKTIENVARRDSVASPFDRKSKLAKNAEIKTKIIDENKKLVGIVKKTKEESAVSGAKKKEYDNVVFNPSLNKPDVGTTNNSY